MEYGIENENWIWNLFEKYVFRLPQDRWATLEGRNGQIIYPLINVVRMPVSEENAEL